MPRVKPGPPCEICGAPSAARNLCAMHLKRWQRHGHTEQTRPNDWGKREKHPLYVVWSRLKNQTGSSRVPEWDDFWRFVSEIGERRSDDHWLWRKNRKLPFGPDNFFWREFTVVKTLAPGERKNPNAYSRAWRRVNWGRSAEHDRKKTYGITSDEYAKMLADQNEVCAICRKPEALVHKKTGRLRALSVDHCHKSGKVRGLLCGHCNNGLGAFKDSIERLEFAIAYLRRHAA